MTGDEPEPVSPAVSPPFARRLAPWSARHRRWARLAVLLLVLLPVVAVFATIRYVGTSPEVRLATAGGSSTADVLRVRAVIRNIDPVNGEISARLSFAPFGSYSGPKGLAEPLRVLVVRTTGNGVLTFARNEPMAPVDLGVALDESRVTRYPLDRYTAELTVVAVDANDERVPVELELLANVSDFDLSARGVGRADNVTSLAIRVQRGWSTLSWSVIMAIVFWVLGLGAASIVWMTVVDSRPIPMWSWGFFAGMLFSLPALRASLPGNPRLGALIDWGSFYWSVSLVVLSMTTHIVMWNLRARAGHSGGAE